jgi:hypothetical protein
MAAYSEGVHHIWAEVYLVNADKITWLVKPAFCEEMQRNTDRAF